MVKTLTAAKVVIGVDVMSGHEFILFGREELKRFAGSEDGESLPALYIGLDQDTDELEKACAMMLAVKGRCDYAGGKG